MAYRSSTTASGSSATPAVAVPAGVAADDRVVIAISFDATAAVIDSGDLPTGFVELDETDITADGHTGWIGQKLLTGADTGSYTFGNVGATADWVIQAVAFSGRHTTNPPVKSTVNVQNTPQSSPITVTANGVTALDGDDLMWVSVPDVTSSGAGNGHTAPTNYTERQDAENAWSNLSVATRDNVGAGATGNISGTFNLSQDTAGWAAWLIRIPAAGGTTFNITPSGSVTPTGALSKQDQKTIVGAVTPTGVVIKQAQKLFTGSIAPSGALSTLRAIVRSFSGTVTPVGSLANQVQKGLAGSVAMAGEIAKFIAKVLVGSATPAGALQTAKVILLSLSGAITPTGALTRQVGKSLAGAITPIGSILKQIAKFLTGLISPSGVLTTQYSGAASEIGIAVEFRQVAHAVVRHEVPTCASIRVEVVGG